MFVCSVIARQLRSKIAFVEHNFGVMQCQQEQVKYNFSILEVTEEQYCQKKLSW